jgi:hypothetical protein
MRVVILATFLPLIFMFSVVFYCVPQGVSPLYNQQIKTSETTKQADKPNASRIAFGVDG